MVLELRMTWRLYVALHGEWRCVGRHVAAISKSIVTMHQLSDSEKETINLVVRLVPSATRGKQLFNDTVYCLFRCGACSCDDDTATGKQRPADDVSYSQLTFNRLRFVDKEFCFERNDFEHRLFECLVLLDSVRAMQLRTRRIVAVDYSHQRYYGIQRKAAKALFALFKRMRPVPVFLRRRSGWFEARISVGIVGYATGRCVACVREDEGRKLLQHTWTMPALSLADRTKFLYVDFGADATSEWQRRFIDTKQPNARRAARAIRQSGANRWRARRGAACYAGRRRRSGAWHRVARHRQPLPEQSYCDAGCVSRVTNGVLVILQCGVSVAQSRWQQFVCL